VGVDLVEVSRARAMLADKARMFSTAC